MNEAEYQALLKMSPMAVELVAKMLRAGNSPQQIGRIFRNSSLHEHIEPAAEHMFKNCLHLPERQTEDLPTVQSP